jgi:hypothetical protein
MNAHVNELLFFLLIHLWQRALDEEPKMSRGKDFFLPYIFHLSQHGILSFFGR